MNEKRKVSELPILLTAALMMLAKPLEGIFHVPSSITISSAAIVLLGWFVIYGVNVWHQTARDKKESEAKDKTAKARLFDGK